MKPSEQKRFDRLYQRHLRALKLRGFSKRTIDAYACAVRRVAAHYDCCPDQLTVEQLSGSGEIRYRTLPGTEFLWLVIQHVLPKGFRRVRDVGILHGKSRRWLQLVQRILSVTLSPSTPREPPCIACPQCQLPMRAIGFIRPAWRSG